jgi:hypothetical protein
MWRYVFEIRTRGLAESWHLGRGRKAQQNKEAVTYTRQQMTTSNFRRFINLFDSLPGWCILAGVHTKKDQSARF